MSSVMIPQHWRSLLGETKCETVLPNGFPHRKWEAWKYSDVNAIVNHQFHLPQQQLETPDISTDFVTADCLKIVFVDGMLSSTMSDMDSLPAGVIVKQEVVNADSDYSSYADKPFVALNHALTTNSLTLEVSDNQEIKPIIHLVFVDTGRQADVMRHWQHNFIVGVNARISIVEEYLSQAGSCYFNNIATKIELKQGACADFCKLQQESTSAFHIANTAVIQASDSQINSYNISVGGLFSRDDLSFDLKKTAAKCNFYGLYLASNKQHIDHHTIVNHAASHCESNQLYKGVVADNARAVFNGKVLVAKDTLNTVAHQANHNLLLSSNAEVDTKPELEVYADDVQCSHGATVGQLDEASLFYLQSRGISYDDARQLLMASFINEVVLTITNENLKRYVDSVLQSKEL